jgi:formylglycine-generating enzyme required for sulfatase activity
VTNALNKAREELVANGRTERFAELLQSVAAELPEIELSTEPGQVVWNKLRLYDHGLLLNAFRFTSPLNEPGDFFWCFASSGDVGSWYILPGGENPASEYQGSNSAENIAVEGLDLSINTTMFQELSHGQIAPKQTSIVYFAARNTEAMPLRVAARIMPAREHYFDSGSRPNRILLKLGLSKLPKLAPTPESRVLKGHPNVLVRLAWKPTDELISFDAEGNLYTWSADEAEPLSKTATGVIVDNVSVARDGKKAVLSSIHSPELVVWDLETNQRAGAFSVPAGTPMLTRMSPDGKSVYVACSVGQAGINSNLVRYDIVQFSLDSLDVVAKQTDVVLGAYRLHATPSGVRLVGFDDRDDAGSQPASVRLPLDLSQPPVVRSYRGYITLDSCPVLGGTRELDVDLYGYLRLFDPTRPDDSAYEAAIPHNLYHVCPLTDDRFAALGTYEGPVLLYDCQERQVCMEWIGHQDWIVDLAPSPDGKWLASASKDGTIRLWDQSQRSHPRLAAETLVDSEGHELKPIPATEFLMGSSPNHPCHPRDFYFIGQLNQERPQHRVRITRPYYLASKEVSVAQFRRFVEATGYVTANEQENAQAQSMTQSGQWTPQPGLTWKSPGVEQTEDHPVVQITYEDAKAYCDWLSQVEDAVYRLPTEAEWEFACGADPTTQYSFTNTTRSAELCANVSDESMLRAFNGSYNAGNWDDRHPYAAKVGTGLANRFGLFEMHGNAWEYCQDTWTERYHVPAEADYVAIDPVQESQGPHVCRGGSFYYLYSTARSCRRDCMQLGLTQSDQGFRVLREMPASEQP